MLRLNRLKMYLAANISNPLMAPALLLIELQTGAWLRRRDFHDLTLEAFARPTRGVFGSDLLLGALVVGTVIGTIATILTAVTVGRSRELPPHIDRVFAAAADAISRPALRHGSLRAENSRAIPFTGASSSISVATAERSLTLDAGRV